MLSKLINLIPRDWLVILYKNMPFSRFKNWVVYRSQQKFLVAVLGIFTNDAGQILLLKHVYRKEPWGMPGGWMELEQPQAALEREVYEETKLKVAIDGKARAIFGIKPNRVDLIYTGRVTGGTFVPSVEISEAMFCDVDQWPEGMPDVQKKLIKETISSIRP